MMTDMEDKALAMLKKAHRQDHHGRNADIVGTMVDCRLKVGDYTLLINRHDTIEGHAWAWNAAKDGTTRAGGGYLPDLYTAIERGKEWIAHAK